MDTKGKKWTQQNRNYCCKRAKAGDAKTLQKMDVTKKWTPKGKKWTQKQKNGHDKIEIIVVSGDAKTLQKMDTANTEAAATD